MTTTMIGCQSSPKVLEFNQDKIELKAEMPLDKCEWPELFESVAEDGSAIIYMTAEGLKQQRACQVTEQSNYDTALGNAGTVDDAVAAFNSLIDKSMLHNQYSQNELDRVDEERKRKRNEVMGYQGLLALVLIAVAL